MLVACNHGSWVLGVFGNYYIKLFTISKSNLNILLIVSFTLSFCILYFSMFNPLDMEIPETIMFILQSLKNMLKPLRQTLSMLNKRPLDFI